MVRLSKAAIGTKINSGEWPTPLSNDILDRCCEIAQYTSQSRNHEDIIEQKHLWIKMVKEPVGYDDKRFCLEWLNYISLQHLGRTPLCMQYLRKVKDEVTAETGQWRLWEPSQDVPRAETVYMTEMQLQPENISELKRIKGNLEDVLENRKEGAMLNRSLTPPRNPRPRSKRVRGEQRGKGSAKGDAKGEREPQQPDKGKLMEARSKAGPPVGSGESSSYRASSRSRPETKEPPVGAPFSWMTFELTAKNLWRYHADKMMMHEICNFPKTLRIIIRSCICLLYTSPSPRDLSTSRMPSSA